MFPNVRTTFVNAFIDDCLDIRVLEQRQNYLANLKLHGIELDSDESDSDTGEEMWFHQRPSIGRTESFV